MIFLWQHFGHAGGGRYWVVPEKIHTPPHGGNFCCPKGEGGKMS